MRPTGRSGFRIRAVLLFLFTLSGASGLVYEVLWTRRLTHVFGSTTLAVSTVLAAFMLGLAIGSVALGRWADRRRDRALGAYGLLELGIGVYGFAIPFGLRALESAYVGLAPVLESAPMIFFVAQFLLAGGLLAIPCVLMGGTLPVLARWLIGRRSEIGERVGALYAANTLGACAGTAVATYVLLPRAGVRTSELVAVALNVVAGLSALALSRRWLAPEAPAEGAPAAEVVEAESSESAGSSPRSRLLLAAIALSGFAAMVDEVTWSRLVGLVFGSSVYAFGLMLLLFLAGIAAGSAIYARLRQRDPARVLGWALVGNAFAALIGIGLLPHLPFAYMRGYPAVQGAFFWDQALQVAATAPALLPIAILFGVAFPAAVAATADLATTGRGIGRVTAWNTAGTVAGAFLGGFVLIPRLGLRPALTLAAAATALGGILALSRPGLEHSRRRAIYAAAAAVVAALALPAWPHGLLAQGAGFYAAIYGSSEGLREATRNSELLFYEDGIATTLSVDRQGPYRFYRSNGKTDASTDPGDMTNQLLLGHLPMLRHPAPQDVFVLGLGTGVSAASVARYPVRSIDIADIEGASRNATRLFAPENRDILADPRVTMLVADGRNALLARSKTYDVIISDPSDVWVAGVGNLFTREFYELARRRLKPGGLMVQWFHMHSLPPEQMKLIVATFRSVFRNASLWRPNRGDIILMGSVEPVPWNLARLRERFEKTPGVSGDLRPYGFWDPVSIFAAFCLDGADLDTMLADVRGLHTDDHPVVEYLSPRAARADTTSANDAGIQALQTKTLPPIEGLDEAKNLDGRSRYLLGFALASIGRVDPGIRLMEESVREDRPDPDFLVGLGNQYQAKGWSAKAVAAYERALALEPGQAEASVRLAELLRASGDDAGAERRLRAGLEKHPGEGPLAAAAARLYLDLEHPDKALAALGPALASQPGEASLLVLNAETLTALGRGNDADAAAKAAAAADPGNAETQRRAGAVLFAIADLDGALAAYERAVALEPSNVVGLVGLARTRYGRGDAASAGAARDAALALDPYDASALALGRPAASR
jgi:spermidine synthase